jgi:GDP-4-dehydro-6-deoxy-D-mannose reductase
VPDFAHQVVIAERGGSTEINVGNLASKRDYTDVRDIVRAYRLLVESENTADEIFNICSGSSISCQTILDTLFELSDAKLTVVQDPSKIRPSDIIEIVGDHSKLTKKTGWVPTYSLQDTLADALNDWRSREA